MKKLLLFLLWPALALAQTQSTTLSSTGVIDQDGSVWINGSYTVTFQPSPAWPSAGSYTWSGGNLQQNLTFSGALSPTATFSRSVPSNNAITPLGSQWRITVCPLATLGCVSTTVQATGAAFDVTSIVNSAAVGPRFPCPQTCYGYNTVEVTNPLPKPGAIFWNTTGGSQYTWNGAAWVSSVITNPGTITGVTAGTGLSGGGTSGTVTLNIANTAVTAGTYTNPTITVNPQGQITAATSAPANLAGQYIFTTTGFQTSSNIGCTGSNPYTCTAFPTGNHNCTVILVNGGGGGGSGATCANTATCFGGGGGAGGGGQMLTLPCFTFGGGTTATVTIQVGAGGTGGAAQSTASSSGNTATSVWTATASSISGSAAGGFGVVQGVQYVSGTINGSGGTTTTGTAGANGSPSSIVGCSGSAGASGAGTVGLCRQGNSVGASTVAAGGGGAGGGGLVSGAAAAGGAQQWGTAANQWGYGPAGTTTQGYTPASLTGGVAPGGAGQTPTFLFAPPNPMPLAGLGGTGGASSCAGNGGAGGNGMTYGSGGGGGGAACNGSSSGAGGNGSGGIVMVLVN